MTYFTLLVENGGFVQSEEGILGFNRIQKEPQQQHPPLLPPMTTNTIDTAVVYDDPYASQNHTSEGDYVTSLPTADEEKQLLDDDDVRCREDTFDLSEKLNIQDQNNKKCQQHEDGASDENSSSTNNDQQESGRTATMLDFFLKIFFSKNIGHHDRPKISLIYGQFI